MVRNCQNCNTILEDDTLYCPECGERYNPKPSISKGTMLGLILLTIFIFPLGVVVSILILYAHRKEVEDWQMERLISKNNS